MAPLVKICGLTDPEQAMAIAALGASAIGVIAVPQSPRWLEPPRRAPLFAAVRRQSPTCQGVLVVADPADGDLAALGSGGGHQVVQLHGQETPERCRQLRQRLDVQLWKALRIRRPEDLKRVEAYGDAVDALLLDAWAPDQLGGTGLALPIDWLRDFVPPLPWWLAGGLRADRLPAVLAALRPTGLDVSSGVERSPGDKDLQQVAELLQIVERWP